MIDSNKELEKFKKYVEKKPKILKILKKDQRSYVFIFEYLGKKYVYKEPVEKNRRKWQKFLSIFRGTESKREFFCIKKINSSNFVKTVKPIYYTKKYLIYEYLEGNMPDIKDLDLVIKKLQEIHNAGYLHGDSQIQNFLINKNKEIYIIDSKFQKNKYGKFGAIFEMIYLEESTTSVLNLEISYDKKSFYYKCAISLKKYLIFLRKFKNIIRRR